MKKLITTMLSILFISSYSAVATEYAIGVTAAQHSVEASGQEILRTSAKTTKHSRTEDLTVGDFVLVD